MPEPPPTDPRDLIQKGLSRLFSRKPPEPVSGASASGSPVSGTSATGMPPLAPSTPAAPDARTVPRRPAPTLAALAQLRVQFLDNQNRPLYPLPGRGTSPLSRDEEQVAFARGLSAIREASRAGGILGQPAVGNFAGRDPEQVMAGATADDLKGFLSFVLSNPRSFMQQPIRISEAFLAWLVDRGEP